MRVFHVKVVEVHVVRCYSTENDARTHHFLFTQEEIRQPPKTNQFSNNCVFEGENKGKIKLTWYNWKAHEVL